MYLCIFHQRPYKELILNMHISLEPRLQIVTHYWAVVWDFPSNVCLFDISQPDRSVRLDCSQSKNYVATYQLMGYVRRVRLSWSFSGALLPPQPTSTSSVEQSKTNTSDLSATDRSVTPRNVTSWTYPMEPYSTYRLLHPDFGVLIRITSRMLFQGNFSLERSKSLADLVICFP